MIIAASVAAVTVIIVLLCIVVAVTVSVTVLHRKGDQKGTSYIIIVTLR